MLRRRTATRSERQFLDVRQLSVPRSHRHLNLSTIQLSANTETPRTVGRHPSTPNTTDATAPRITSEVWQSERGHLLISIQQMIRIFANCDRPGKNQIAVSKATKCNARIRHSTNCHVLRIHTASDLRSRGREFDSQSGRYQGQLSLPPLRGK